MKRTIKIVVSRPLLNPANLLVQSGYYYYNKKGGGHSYIKPDSNGRFEAHIKGNVVELHYDVWIGKNGHMVLPSTYTTQAEAKRIVQIMNREIPKTPRVMDPKKKAKLKRKKQRERLGILIPPPPKRYPSLPYDQLKSIDWESVKKTKEETTKSTYPQSTTCTLPQSMLRWIKTKVTPWL